MQPQSTEFVSASRVVPAYRDEDSFLDALHEWMERAPWLALSVLAHAMLLLVLAAIPWDLLREPEQTILQASIEHIEPTPFEEPPPEPEPEPIEDEPVDEPVLEPVPLPTDAVSDDRSDTPADDFGEASDIDTAMPEVSLAHIGIGGGPKFSGRFSKGPGGRGGLGRDTIAALEAGLDWLARHQSPDGSWDADGFGAHCGDAAPCTGPGASGHDVGLTGLALLAFLGDGNTTRGGPYKDNVTRGIHWLKQQQDPDTGLLGEKLGHAFIYNHAIATLAICEAYYFSKSPLLKRTAQDAIHYISIARNPYSAWRYDVPPVGDSDTSVTGWMVLALTSAEDAGLAVDAEAYAGALSWLDEATDPGTGRTGYDSVGSLSSRIARVNDHYPADKGEAMTAVALLCRFFLDQTPDEHPIMKRQAELLSQRLPEWDPDGYGCDMYYWYYGTYAMYQMGGTPWTTWRRAMERAVLGSQRKSGDARGSWDPAGPWGYAGGRVYSTALMTLCLEAYYRYARVVGAR